jgi:hypothetical protein
MHPRALVGRPPRQLNCMHRLDCTAVHVSCACRYKMEKVNMRSYGDKPQSFLSKVPGGLLPVIELDGRVITESLDIMMLLEAVRSFAKKTCFLAPPVIRLFRTLGAYRVCGSEHPACIHSSSLRVERVMHACKFVRAVSREPVQYSFTVARVQSIIVYCTTVYYTAASM